MTKERKITKAMLTLLIEDEQQKLYDKLKHRELSENRKTKLLKDILGWIKLINAERLDSRAIILEKRIKNELIFHGRINWGTK